MSEVIHISTVVHKRKKKQKENFYVYSFLVVPAMGVTYKSPRTPRAISRSSQRASQNENAHWVAHLKKTAISINVMQIQRPFAHVNACPRVNGTFANPGGSTTLASNAGFVPVVAPEEVTSGMIRYRFNYRRVGNNLFNNYFLPASSVNIFLILSCLTAGKLA